MLLLMVMSSWAAEATAALVFVAAVVALGIVWASDQLEKRSQTWHPCGACDAMGYTRHLQKKCLVCDGKGRVRVTGLEIK